MVLLLRGDISVLLAARELFVVLAVDSRVPSACGTPTALPSSVPAFLRDLIAGCWSWSWVEMRIRARVTTGCWSCVEIRVRVLRQSNY